MRRRHLSGARQRATTKQKQTRKQKATRDRIIGGLERFMARQETRCLENTEAVVRSYRRRLCRLLMDEDGGHAVHLGGWNTAYGRRVLPSLDQYDGLEER